MNPIQIKPNIYWVGAVDWNLRHFHGHTYTTLRGGTYNAYLILDDHVTLIDTVFQPYTHELLEKISQIVPLDRIENIIVNHVETDHTGALPELLKHIPQAKLYGTQKCQEGLQKHYFGKWIFNAVKNGDNLNIGTNNLRFIEAPMIHWPDSMFTYCPEEQLLLSNDAFGQQYATNERFDDEVDPSILMEEAAKYYASILWPMSPLIASKIKEIQDQGLPISMIAPSHGLMWRRDPEKILNAYRNWTSNTTKPKVVLVYETMWGSTEKLAYKIVEGLTECNVDVKVFDINQTDKTEIITEMLEAKGFIIGSSTHDNDMLSNLAGFLHFVKGLKPRNRIGAAFGSFGWAGGAVKSIEKFFEETGISLTVPGLSVQYVPNEEEQIKAYEFGKLFGDTLKSQ